MTALCKHNIHRLILPFMVVTLFVITSLCIVGPVVSDDSDAVTDLGVFTGGRNQSSEDAMYSGLDFSISEAYSERIYYVSMGAEVDIAYSGSIKWTRTCSTDFGLSAVGGHLTGTISEYGYGQWRDAEALTVSIVCLDPNAITDLGEYHSGMDNVSSPRATFSYVGWLDSDDTIYASLGANVYAYVDFESTFVVNDLDLEILITGIVRGTITNFGTTTIQGLHESRSSIVCLAVTHSVTFDSMGGSDIPGQAIESGSVAVPPSNPTLTGHVFDCWSTSPDVRTPYDFNTPVTSDLTLYAFWVDELVFTTAPTSSGTVSAVQGMAGTILCDATQSTDYTSLLWDLGDGAVSADNYVMHYYSQPGTYTVTLTAYNSQGADVTTFTVEVPEAPDDGGGDDLLLWVAVGLLVVLIVAVVATRLL